MKLYSGGSVYEVMIIERAAPAISKARLLRIVKAVLPKVFSA